MFALCGLRIEETFGDYALGAIRRADVAAIDSRGAEDRRPPGGATGATASCGCG